MLTLEVEQNSAASMWYASEELLHPREGTTSTQENEWLFLWDLLVACPHYEVSDPLPVVEAFRRNPELAFLAIEAHAEILKAFGDSVAVQLEVVSDPEDHDVHYLLASVLADISRSDARARLQTFDEAWFLERAGDADGTFVVALRFV